MLNAGVFQPASSLVLRKMFWRATDTDEMRPPFSRADLDRRDAPGKADLERIHLRPIETKLRLPTSLFGRERLLNYEMSHAFNYDLGQQPVFKAIGELSEIVSECHRPERRCEIATTPTGPSCCRRNV